MTGGGFPMRFADTDGSLIDVYQENTNMDDEASQVYPATVNALLDNATGPNGYYGVFGTNIHNDNPAPSANDDAIVASAQAHGVPMIAYKQLLTWVDGRNASTIRGMNWNAGTFTFVTTIAAGAGGLRMMLPTQGPTGTLSALTCGGSPETYTVQTDQGIQYAVFTAALHVRGDVLIATDLIGRLGRPWTDARCLAGGRNNNARTGEAAWAACRPSINGGSGTNAFRSGDGVLPARPTGRCSCVGSLRQALWRRTHSTRAPGTIATDASGNGRTGAVTGATWATGRYGGALSFDGNNDYVGLPGLGTFYNLGLHARGLGSEGNDEERRGDRRHVGRQRADVVDRPSGDAPPAHARRQPLLVSRLRDRAQLVGQWQHRPPPSTARLRATTSTAPRWRHGPCPAPSARRTRGGSARTAPSPAGSSMA
jgi:hypothetical protein